MRRILAGGFAVLAASALAAGTGYTEEEARSGSSTVAVIIHDGCDVAALSAKLKPFGLKASEPEPVGSRHFSGDRGYTRPADAYVEVPRGYAQHWAEIVSDIACVDEAWPASDLDRLGHITVTAAEHGAIKVPSNAAAMLIKMDRDGGIEGLAEILVEYLDGLKHDGASISASATGRDSANVTFAIAHGGNQKLDEALGLRKGDKLIVAGQMITVVNCGLGSIRIYYSFEPVLDRMGLSAGGMAIPEAPRKREAVIGSEQLGAVRDVLRGLATAIRNHLETSTQAKPVLIDVGL